MADSTNRTVRNALAANADNTLLKEYVNRAKAVLRQLVQKVGDAQNELFQQSEKLKILAQKNGDEKEPEKIFNIHRQVDIALDMVSENIKSILR